MSAAGSAQCCVRSLHRGDCVACGTLNAKQRDDSESRRHTSFVAGRRSVRASIAPYHLPACGLCFGYRTSVCHRRQPVNRLYRTVKAAEPATRIPSCILQGGNHVISGRKGIEYLYLSWVPARILTRSSRAAEHRSHQVSPFIEGAAKLYYYSMR